MRGFDQKQCGFTLLELLVTLIILAGTAGLISQATWQVYRIETALAESQLLGPSDALRAEWIRQSLSGIQSGDASGNGRLRGNHRELRGMTSNPITGSPAGHGVLHMRLRFDETTGETLLEVAHQNRQSSEFQALLRWPGDAGRFIYITREGRNEEQWPSTMGKQAQIPAAIVLETRLEGCSMIVAAPQTMEGSQPTRREIEQL